MRTVLVCGGRDFADRALVFRVLDAMRAGKGLDRLVHGGAAGADRLAAEWALDRGVEQVAYQPDWKGLGRAAGPTRNQKMLVEERPAVVVAFPGGAGTRDMCRRARQAKVVVLSVKSASGER